MVGDGFLSIYGPPHGVEAPAKRRLAVLQRIDVRITSWRVRVDTKTPIDGTPRPRRWHAATAEMARRDREIGDS